MSLWPITSKLDKFTDDQNPSAVRKTSAVSINISWHRLYSMRGTWHSHWIHYPVVYYDVIGLFISFLSWPQCGLWAIKPGPLPGQYIWIEGTTQKNSQIGMAFFWTYLTSTFPIFLEGWLQVIWDDGNSPIRRKPVNSAMWGSNTTKERMQNCRIVWNPTWGISKRVFN